MRRTRALVGPGLMIGLAIGALLTIGATLMVVTHLVLVLAGVLALVSVGRNPDVKLGFRRPGDGLSILALLLGGTAATGLIVEAAELIDYSSSRADEATVYIVVAVLVLIGVVLGVVVRPRAFGSALLGGTSAGGVASVTALFAALPSSETGAGWGIALGAVIALGVVAGLTAYRVAAEAD